MEEEERPTDEEERPGEATGRRDPIPALFFFRCQMSVLCFYYLIAWLAVVLGINSTHNAGNFTRRSQVKLLLALLVLLISNTTAYHAIIYS